MEYYIVLPDRISDEWFNLGIDFAPMVITGTNRKTLQDSVLISLKTYCIALDNRYIKHYEIIRNETNTSIKVKV